MLQQALDGSVPRHSQMYRDASGSIRRSFRFFFQDTTNGDEEADPDLVASNANASNGRPLSDQAVHIQGLTPPPGILLGEIALVPTPLLLNGLGAWLASQEPGKRRAQGGRVSEHRVVCAILGTYFYLFTLHNQLTTNHFYFSSVYVYVCIYVYVYLQGDSTRGWGPCQQCLPTVVATQQCRDLHARSVRAALFCLATAARTGSI